MNSPPFTRRDVSDSPQPATPSNLFASHPRSFEQNRYVYPVVSRRAGGVSIGVNLNLDKVCNFDCIYCQVNRSEPGEREFVELDRLAAELDAAVGLVTSGRIFEQPKFSQTPPPLRRLNDIALSGDGEPTTYRNFDDVIAACAEVRRRHRLDDVKLVLITNASMLHCERVRRGLEMLDAANGEIWAKLDAGTEAHYNLVARSSIPFARILENLRNAARVRPIVIQSLFMRIRGEPPSTSEQDAYCARLAEIVAAGGRIKLVQVHTIARPPAESWVAPLDDAQVDALAALVRRRTRLAVTPFHSQP
jgi:wyosine [tRNA(Phe)-imidazoG37] synthetase (radical SAM superfamily)